MNTFGPSVPDVLAELQARNAISDRDHQLYLRNYSFFCNEYEKIKRDFRFMWIASLNHHIYADTTRDALKKQIENERGALHAYMTHVF